MDGPICQAWQRETQVVTLDEELDAVYSESIVYLRPMVEIFLDHNNDFCSVCEEEEKIWAGAHRQLWYDIDEEAWIEEGSLLPKNPEDLKNFFTATTI